MKKFTADSSGGTVEVWTMDSGIATEWYFSTYKSITCMYLSLVLMPLTQIALILVWVESLLYELNLD